MQLGIALCCAGKDIACSATMPEGSLFTQRGRLPKGTVPGQESSPLAKF